MKMKYFPEQINFCNSPLIYYLDGVMPGAKVGIPIRIDTGHTANATRVYDNYQYRYADALGVVKFDLSPLLKQVSENVYQDVFNEPTSGTPNIADDGFRKIKLRIPPFFYTTYNGSSRSTDNVNRFIYMGGYREDEYEDIDLFNLNSTNGYLLPYNGQIFEVFSNLPFYLSMCYPIHDGIANRCTFELSWGSQKKQFDSQGQEILINGFLPDTCTEYRLNRYFPNAPGYWDDAGTWDDSGIWNEGGGGNPRGVYLIKQKGDADLDKLVNFEQIYVYFQSQKYGKSFAMLDVRSRVENNSDTLIDKPLQTFDSVGGFVQSDLFIAKNQARTVVQAGKANTTKWEKLNLLDMNTSKKCYYYDAKHGKWIGCYIQVTNCQLSDDTSDFECTITLNSKR